MEELHAQGRSADDIRECLRSAPLDAHVLSAIRTASALGYGRTPICRCVLDFPRGRWLDLDGGRCTLQV